MVLRGWTLGQVAASVPRLVLWPSQSSGLWRGAGESFWRERAGERAVRECIILYKCIRLTPIFHTVLNYSTTGSRSRVVVREFWGMQGLVVLWSLHLPLRLTVSL